RVVAKLSNTAVNGGAAIIKVPHAGGSEIHVSYPDAIDVSSQREKRIAGIVSDKPSRDAESAGMRPTVRPIVELRHFSCAIDWFIPKTRQWCLQPFGHASDDNVVSGELFQSLQHRIETKTRIGPQPNLSDVGRYIGEAGIQQFNAAIPSSGIAGCNSHFARSLSRAPVNL